NSLLTSGFACEIIHRNNPLSALKSAIQMKSPITAEMTMALMPCLLISTSALSPASGTFTT
ncbi:hypothetical protein BVZ27_29345, partial [Klebsiella pneumoniae]|uniref:hypothetical protein n=1 Tax=Klebsiella pneumoniae TaxID=573 RepID=UPI000A2E98D7